YSSTEPECSCDISAFEYSSCQENGYGGQSTISFQTSCNGGEMCEDAAASIDYGNISMSYTHGQPGSKQFAVSGGGIGCAVMGVGFGCSCSGGSCTISWDGTEFPQGSGMGTIKVFVDDQCSRNDFLYINM